MMTQLPSWKHKGRLLRKFEYCSPRLVESWDIKFAFTFTTEAIYIYIVLYEKACGSKVPKHKDSKSKLGIEARYSWH